MAQYNNNYTSIKEMLDAWAATEKEQPKTQQQEQQKPQQSSSSLLASI